MANTNVQGEKYWSAETMIYDRPHPRLRFMARQIARFPQHRLLDIGCSTAALRDLLPRHFEYFGCDITDHAAQKLPAGHFLQADFNRGDGLGFFRDKQISALHIGGVLEYLHKPEALLQEARALVQAGSPLILSIINFEGKRFREVRQHHPAWVYKPGLSQVQQLLSETRWKVERTWPLLERSGLRGRWLQACAQWLGPENAWMRREAKQFILRARAV